jgi:sporulation protein YlmC with PRC-barrel domain
MYEMRIKASNFLGKMIISKETGRKFGVANNINFIVESGELLNIIVENPTKHLIDLNLRKDRKDRIIVSFSAVKSVGDFVVISEDELM